MKRLTILITAAVLAPVPAMAHPGHLGELAGHSHWLALGALAAAVAIAAVVAKATGKAKEEADDEEPDGAEDEAAAQG